MFHHLGLHGILCIVAWLCLIGIRVSAQEPSRSGNRLASEKSPYLLQHAHNPVDWYPWSDEAFERAHLENKPVFLSIGYSTCHWCHVMEHESFADEATARFLNAHFICIKLDREERPDVDRIYMAFQQRMYGHGGWPLSVWLTPERIPFASGTYFPPEPREGMPSFTQVCRQILAHWESNGELIRSDPEAIREKLAQMLMFHENPHEATDRDQTLRSSAHQRAYQRLAGMFIANPAGFAKAPRFPRADILDFLLQYHLDTSQPPEQREEALAMARATLDAMAQGGIRDHLGGGFHRYSVDRSWHVPHFEKMLYDQAQIARSYLSLYQITEHQAHADIAREILTYILRDLGHPDGAFYSAEDADSYARPGDARKSEGAFYIWTAEEIEKILGPEESDLFSRAYGVHAGGNIEAGSDPHGELKGHNQLHLQRGPTELAIPLDISVRDISMRLASAREKLLAARCQRPRPHRDEKIITAWNALTISALAHAYRALGEESYLHHANRAAGFLLTNLFDAEGSLRRSYLDGPSTIPATAIDYATLIAALIDLYEAGFDSAHLTKAIELQQTMLNLLHDDERGGFYDAPASQSDLIVRMKDLEDGALPSANTLAAVNLMRLYLLTGEEPLHAAAEKIFALASPLLASAPQAALRLLDALDLALQQPPQILIASPRGHLSEARSLLLPAQRSPRHDRVLALIIPDTLPARLSAYQPLDNRPTLYLCRNFTCQTPTTEPTEISRMIAEALAIHHEPSARSDGIPSP